MDIKELSDVGLTNNQARVYLELLQSPGQNPGRLSKSLSIDRAFMYGILNSLLNKGLVSYVVKDKKKFFYPGNPESLLKDVDEKRSKIEGIVKQLKKIHQQTPQGEKVLLYEGKAGLKAYVQDFLEADQFYTFGGGGKLDVLEALRFEYPHYLKDFKNKKIRGKLITSPENKKTMEPLYKSNVSIKTLPGLKSRVSFTIFKKKLVIYSAREKPFVIVINDADASEALKDYFEGMWALIK